MAEVFEILTLSLKKFGCTDPDSYNYNAEAYIDDGSCINKEFSTCVERTILGVDISSSKSSGEIDKNLKIYTIYQSLIVSLKEDNKVKIEMYKEKLADLCNCKTC